jgi:hypothetical protein
MLSFYIIHNIGVGTKKDTIKSYQQNKNNAAKKHIGENIEKT